MARIETPFTPTKTPLVDDQGYVTDLWSAFFDRLFSSVVPTPSGAIVEYAGAQPPAGWLLCNGAIVSRALYSDLFKAIGTRYGTGDGSTTFALPDMTGRVTMGAGDGDLGETGGAEEYTIAQANLPLFDLPVTDPKHTHAFTSDPHNHTIPSGPTSAAGAIVATSVGAGTTSTTSNTTVTGVNSSEATGITVSSGGGGESVNILPPYIKVNFIIKV